MNKLSDLTLILAAGATAAFRPNIQVVPVAERGMVAAYEGLKSLLRERYPAVPIDILDIGPGNQERRALLDDKLRDSGADADAEVLARADQLRQEILRHAPEALVIS